MVEETFSDPKKGGGGSGVSSKTWVKWNRILDCMLFHVIHKHTHENQTNTCTVYIICFYFSFFFSSVFACFQGEEGCRLSKIISPGINV